MDMYADDIFENASDGTEKEPAFPEITQEAVYDIRYFGRADIMTALYTLISQPWLPYIVIDIKYAETGDPSEPSDVRISKGFGRDDEGFTWEDLSADTRKIMQISCRIFPDRDDTDTYVSVVYSYISELVNNGYPNIQADFRHAGDSAPLQSRIFSILRSAGIGV